MENQFVKNIIKVAWNLTKNEILEESAKEKKLVAQTY